MPSGTESMLGARLEFVIRELKGTVKRTHHRAPPTKREIEKNPDLAGDTQNVARIVTEEAGFMIFFPSGASQRLTKRELIQRKLDRPPNLLNREAAKNVETPAGRFILAMNDAERMKAYREMEQEIINRCIGRNGNIAALITDYTPNGKMMEAA